MNFTTTRYDTLVEPTEQTTGLISNIKSHFRNISENEFIAETLNAPQQIVIQRKELTLTLTSPPTFCFILYLYLYRFVYAKNKTHGHKSLHLERCNLIKTFHCRHTYLFLHTASYHIKSSHIQCQNQKTTDSHHKTEK